MKFRIDARRLASEILAMNFQRSSATTPLHVVDFPPFVKRVDNVWAQAFLTQGSSTMRSRIYRDGHSAADLLSHCRTFMSLQRRLRPDYMRAFSRLAYLQKFCNVAPAVPLSSATLGKLLTHTHVPLSPSSIIWYQPMGGDALRLGR